MLIINNTLIVIILHLNTFIQPLIHHFNIHIFIDVKNQINGWENKLKNKLDPSINCVIFNELVENDILRSRSI